MLCHPFFIRLGLKYYLNCIFYFKAYSLYEFVCSKYFYKNAFECKCFTILL